MTNPYRQVLRSAKTNEHRPPFELSLPLFYPTQTPNRNPHFSDDRGFDVVYVTLVYVNTNKETVRLVWLFTVGTFGFVTALPVKPNNMETEFI